MAVSVGRVFRQRRIVREEDLGPRAGEDVGEDSHIVSEERNAGVATGARSEFPTDRDRLQCRRRDVAFQMLREDQDVARQSLTSVRTLCPGGTAPVSSPARRRSR